jgi:hypothetical protein
MAQMQRGIQFHPFGVTSCAAARLAESTPLGRIDLGVRTSQKLVKIVNSPSHVMATSMTPVGSHICNGGYSKAVGSKVLSSGLVSMLLVTSIGSRLTVGLETSQT